MRLNLHIKRFWFNLGWYQGEPFTLFGVRVMEKTEGVLSLLYVSFLGYFVFAFGIS